MKRYSKKRQAILDCLKNTKVHPSVEWIYNELKPQFPDLSLGTVYRNVKELVAEGKISPFGTVLNKERYDGNTMPHAHAVCIKCGKIIDIELGENYEKGLTEVKELEGFTVKTADVKLVGICPDCNGKKDDGFK